MNIICPNTTAPHSLSRLSSFPLTTLKQRRSNFFIGLRSNSIKHELRCSCVTASNGTSSFRNNVVRDTSEECDECVEVIAVGSRKDALMDFCSASPSLSPVLRFWVYWGGSLGLERAKSDADELKQTVVEIRNLLVEFSWSQNLRVSEILLESETVNLNLDAGRNILGNDAGQVQLQQRLLTSKDSSSRTVEDFLAQRSSCKAVILIASAAYGSDHISALEVLSNIKCGNGFVVGIILKPFSFEGKRRQDEVNDLVGKLQKQANFCIVLDTDTLLENDLVTLDEALRTTNNAVLMAINAISIMLSEKHIKFLNAKTDSVREIQLPALREVFERYKEARIGFGAGYNIKTSLLRAINDCPFLGVDIKDLDGVVLCVIASSGVVECAEANNILYTVREITKCNGEIILSIVHEPNLEANTTIATIIVFGYTRKQLAPAPRSGLWSSLGQHFPFILNIFKKQHLQLNNFENAPISEIPQVSNEITPAGTKDMPDTISLDGTNDDTAVISGETQKPLGDAEGKFYSLRNDHRSGEREVEPLDTKFSSFQYELISEGNHVLKRELFTRGSMGPGQSTESKKGTNFADATALVDSVSIYRLPVGVKNLEKLEEAPVSANTQHGGAWRVDDTEKNGPSVSWSGSTDVDFNNTSIFNKGNITNNSKKQGVLSVRAASMLESERDSQKKWSNRVVEMGYRGGIYKGRTQGGLPEGKGRLLLGDGSIYDGMWRYGKRSGLGTFYSKNGDVFQGSWRDDVMHGKGWIYFHTGDRWFVNLWKGKPDGEGRFYSKHGDVFFGHFKDGWRHGHFLRINVDGTRVKELWEEGVLVSEKQMDPDEVD